MNKNPGKPRSPLANESGIALPLVLMLLVIFTLLGTAAYTASQASLKQTTILRPNLQAKYLARSAVDATIAAWTDEWINSPGTAPVEAHFFTKYNDTTDVFEDANPADAGQDKVIETIQAYDSATGICTITANATADGRTATVRAVSEGLVETQSALLPTPWYDTFWYPSLTLPFYRYDYVIIPNPDSSEYATDNDGNRYYASNHYVDGIVNLEAKDAHGVTQTVYLDERKTGYSAIGFQAKRIIFNSPLNLYAKGQITGIFHPQMLVVSAESIDFNQMIIIGDSAHGNLTLHLPDGFGISGEKVYHVVSNADKSKVNLTAKYGLVSFSGVIIRGSFGNNGQPNDPNLIQNKTFYFRHPDDADSLNIGTEPGTFSRLEDLFGWTFSENDFRFQALLDTGYLIPAPTEISTDSDYDVLFVYQ